MTIQMDFLDTCQEDELRRELEETRKQLNNLRRGLFGRYDKMVHEFTALQQSLEEVKQKVGMNHDTDERKVLEFPM